LSPSTGELAAGASFVCRCPQHLDEGAAVASCELSGRPADRAGRGNETERGESTVDHLTEAWLQVWRAGDAFGDKSFEGVGMVGCAEVAAPVEDRHSVDVSLSPVALDRGWVSFENGRGEKAGIA
jgi:hypothetical protein